MDKFSYLSNTGAEVIDDLYKKFQENPDSVDISWRRFFEGFEFANKTYPKKNKTENSNNIINELESEESSKVVKEFQVIQLINGYRRRGHLFTETNPVRKRRTYTPTLDIENFGLTKEDLEIEFEAGNDIGIGKAKLKDIVAHLEETYCKAIGVEFRHLGNPIMVNWLQKQMEADKNTPNLPKADKLYILELLNKAVVFEKFLHTKFVGQKRFSLEGAESLIPALASIISRGSRLGIEEFVIGMAHRGRLNILVNILGKEYEDVFVEFEGKAFEDAIFEGDVKYHMGWSNNIISYSGNEVHVGLLPNPSHLEAVDPVTEGNVRAKIDHHYDGDEKKIAPILIHGDAAIAAQGIVYEVIQMSLLDGYRTGGTIHIVINNQVGFTTNYLDARSSTYCTDISKTTQSPAFHVNGDEPEAMVYAIDLAMEFRQQFHRDIFIDLLCYRKHGHNEGDEPRFTQPVLYDLIAKHKNPRDIYFDKLLAEGVVEKDDLKKIEKAFKKELQEELQKAKDRSTSNMENYLIGGKWAGLRQPVSEDFLVVPETRVSKEVLLDVADKINFLPDNLPLFKKTRKLFDDRKKMVENNKLDWALGELLAYGTLLEEQFPIRLSGQDVQRGTFAHRHSVLKLEHTEETYVPLNNLSDKQAKFSVYNSLLSEYGVLGFELGYSVYMPNQLTIWEAQFGDFANGAQIIIDQFLSCSETKWSLMSGLVLLLPHGYEGQGPEHSSARMERFLTLSSKENWIIANCSTPANIFHALRRQIKAEYRIPLIIFTPKSLLRHPRCTSTVEEFTEGDFLPVIDDPLANSKKVEKVLFCSGKVYYELLAKKEADKLDEFAIVRIEQLFPLPEKWLDEVVEKYTNAKEFIWVQEEPENMGAWSYLMRVAKKYDLQVVSRKESETPATGFKTTHDCEIKTLLEQAFSKELIKDLDKNAIC